MVGSGKAWGLCTAVDLQDCNPDLIRNADHIRRYVVELCELIDMKRFGECQVVDFGSGRVAGYSMVQLISTSLISGHFANDTNNAYLDIFSCKGYDPARRRGVLQRVFRRASQYRDGHAPVLARDRGPRHRGSRYDPRRPLAFPRTMNPTTIKEFFQLLPGQLDSDAAEDLDAVYQFDLSGAQGGQYILTIREGPVVTRGDAADPHVVLSMAERIASRF